MRESHFTGESEGVEMDAVEFLKTEKRMCENFIGICVGCPIYNEKIREHISCDKYMREYPEKTVAIVEKWLAEHPRKTRQSEFLKLFPDAKLDSNGISMIAPCHIEANLRDSEMCGKMTSCPECRKAYWGEEME